jgi:hypothetical protein
LALPKARIVDLPRIIGFDLLVFVFRARPLPDSRPSLGRIA